MTDDMYRTTSEKHASVLAEFRRQWPVASERIPEEIQHPTTVAGWNGERDPDLDVQAARIWIRAKKTRERREKRAAKKEQQ